MVLHRTRLVLTHKRTQLSNAIRSHTAAPTKLSGEAGV